jgi:deoxyribodipyrimidine photolyase
MEETVKFMQMQINALQEELKKKDAIIQQQEKDLLEVLKKYAEKLEVTL